MPATPQHISSPLAEASQSYVDSLSAANIHRQLRESQTNAGTSQTGNYASAPPRGPPVGTINEEEPEKEYVSKIGVLTTSLPMYHNQVMKKRHEEHARQKLLSRKEEGGDLSLEEEKKLSELTLELGPKVQSSEEQTKTAQHLKPHSRSSVHLQNIAQNAKYLDSKETIAAKPKGKSTKWQFGIRSRNEPVDAIKCLYKALKSMGDCQWHVNPPKNRSEDSKKDDGGPYPVNVAGATHLTAIETTLSESPEKDKHYTRNNRRENKHSPPGFSGDSATEPRHRPSVSASVRQDDSDSENDDDVDPNVFPPGYLPKDPWCIHVRWEKKGMCPPWTINSNSAQSSRIDLNSSDGSGRRMSITIGSLSSAAGSTTSVGNTGALTNFDDTACFVYLDLQIYVLEPDTYLVDFKCAGYELIVNEKQVMNKKGEIITEYIGSGLRVADKDVTSPQPFLDLANKLVIHLAKGG